MVNNKISVNVVDGLQSILDRVVDYDNITNCITEIPQDIKLELADGVLTLKAGSKVYVPNGAGVFDEVTVASDLTITYTWNDKLLVYVRKDGAGLLLSSDSKTVSGTTDSLSGVAYHNWYDTNNNVIHRYTDDTSTPAFVCSLPICRITSDDTGISSIDQVFNGFGYIGSTAFILPGVKGLMSDGWNADGTYNNIVSQLKSVYTYTFTDTNSTRALCLMFGNVGGYASGGMEEVDILPTSPVSMRRYYLKSKNEWFWWQNGVWTTDHLVKLADVVTESGVIKSLKPQLPFRAVDQNDFNKLDEEVAALDAQNVKLTGYQIINGDKIFTGQVIKAASSNTPMMTSRQNHVTLGTNPSANTNTYIANEDKSGADQSYISFGVKTDGSGFVTVMARSNSASDRSSKGMGITRKLDGTSTMYITTTTATAPTPATSDNSTKIATTAYVNNKFQKVDALPDSPDSNIWYFIKE